MDNKLDLTFVVWLKKRGESLLDSLVKKYVMELPPAPAGMKGDTGGKGDPGDPATFVGAYETGTTYKPGEVVEYRGSSYTPSKSTNTPPHDSSVWITVARRGADGRNGRNADITETDPRYLQKEPTADQIINIGDHKVTVVADTTGGSVWDYVLTGTGNFVTRLYRYAEDALGSRLGTYRARGTESTPTALQNGDAVDYHSYYGYDGSGFREGIRVTTGVDSSPVAGSAMPMFWAVSADPTGTHSSYDFRVDSNGKTNAEFLKLGATTYADIFGSAETTDNIRRDELFTKFQFSADVNQAAAFANKYARARSTILRPEYVGASKLSSTGISLVGDYTAIHPQVPAGISIVDNSTFVCRARVSQITRNGVNTAGANPDNGTMSWLYAHQMSYGNSNAEAGATPITETLVGEYLFPQFTTGTVTLCYDFYITRNKGASGTIGTHWSIFQHATTEAKNSLSANAASRTIIGNTTHTDDGVNKLQLTGDLAFKASGNGVTFFNAASGGVTAKKQTVSAQPCGIHTWLDPVGTTLALSSATHAVFNRITNQGPNGGITFTPASGVYTFPATTEGHYFLWVDIAGSCSGANNRVECHWHRMLGGSPAPATDPMILSMGRGPNKFVTSGDEYPITANGCITVTPDQSFYLAISLSAGSTTMTFTSASVIFSRQYYF